MLDSVVFLAVYDGNKHIYAGTAFVVSVPSEVHQSWADTYLVTAAHCVRKARECGSNLFVRVNRPASSAKIAELDNNLWIKPDDEYAHDAAIVPVVIDRTIFRLKSIRVEMLLDRQMMKQKAIGPGDDAYVVGLFAPQPGGDRNIPVVRSGILSSVASDDAPLFDPKTGARFVPHLVEVRSIGGLSGSPVFIRHGPFQYKPDVTGPVSGSEGTYDLGNQVNLYLLGLIRGHSMESDVLNSGIAHVTPAETICDLLYQEDLVNERKENELERRQLKAEQETVLDSAVPNPAPELTREQFYADLTKATEQVEEEHVSEQS
jgi:hypothetical protein